MGDKISWCVRGSFRGARILGVNKYKPLFVGNPPEWELVLVAVAEPEGGAFDTFISYDGTAATWGIAQWTFTSGRLQKLLSYVREHCEDLWLDSGVEELLDDLGLVLDPAGNLRDKDTNNRVIKKDTLRSIFTPPGGYVPKTRRYREVAENVALTLSKLGEHTGVGWVQVSFFIHELLREARYGRPCLHGKSIAEYLYATNTPSYDYTAPIVDPYLSVSRALFWSMWQNSPRKAELHLKAAWGCRPYNGPERLRSLERIFARSDFANWGVAKARRNDREARFTKTAKAINAVMGKDYLNPYLT